MSRANSKNIIEVIGLAAIVASLIFVALEVREVNLASKIAARDSITQGHLDFMGSLVDQNVLPIAMWKLEGHQELTDFEAYQIDIHHQRRWRHYERIFYMYQYGLLTDEEWGGFQRTIYDSMNIESPFAQSSRDTWHANKNSLSEGFANFVDTMIERKE